MGFGLVLHLVFHLESLRSGSSSAYLNRGSVRPSGFRSTGRFYAPSCCPSLPLPYCTTPPNSLPRAVPHRSVSHRSASPSVDVTPLRITTLRCAPGRSAPLRFASLTPLAAVATMDYVNKYEGRTLWGEGRDLVAKWGATKVIMRARPAGESERSRCLARSGLGVTHCALRKLRVVRVLSGIIVVA